MSNEDSPVFHDIFFSSTAPIADTNDETFFYLDPIDLDLVSQNQINISAIDLNLTDYLREKTNHDEASSIDELFPNSNFELTQETPNLQSVPSGPMSISPAVPMKIPNFNESLFHQCLSLSFANPPEPTYHVRYLSEITNSPLDGNIVNTKKKNKKNISGRYLKGTQGRHVTISIPFLLPDNLHFFIRVTRLTVPYKGTNFVHPYPLLYSPPKKKLNADVIIDGASIYYKLTKDEICGQSKQFPNIILTRLKQCHLKHMSSLKSFDNNNVLHPFADVNAKSKIATYQLKKSQLDFRLVVLCTQTGEFLDLNIFCRSNPLLEEEGTECKKPAKILPSSKFLIASQSESVLSRKSF